MSHFTIVQRSLARIRKMLDLLNKLQLILANCVRDIDAYIAKQAPLDGGGYLLNRTPYLHSEKSTDR